MKKTIAMCELLDRFAKLSQAQNQTPGWWTKAELSLDLTRDGWKDDETDEEDDMDDLEDDKDEDVTKDETNDAILREIDALAELLVRKNKDYGDAAMRSSPLAPELNSATAILVRMGDKIRRLQNLAATREKWVSTESFEDTVRDLAGYCILYLAAPKREYKPVHGEQDD